MNLHDIVSKVETFYKDVFKAGRHTATKSAAFIEWLPKSFRRQESAAVEKPSPLQERLEKVNKVATRFLIGVTGGITVELGFFVFLSGAIASPALALIAIPVAVAAGSAGMVFGAGMVSRSYKEARDAVKSFNEPAAKPPEAPSTFDATLSSDADFNAVAAKTAANKNEKAPEQKPVNAPRLK